MNVGEAQKTIAELANENRFMKKQLRERDLVINHVHGLLIRVGGPLNDNVDQYTRPQLRVFFNIMEHIGDNVWDYTEEDESFYPEED